MQLKFDATKVLDFDCENRPLTYWIPDRPTADLTAIAACWSDEPKSIKCWLLGRDSPTKMLKEFVKLYDEADMVTGHYIREHDLPIINAHLAEYGFPLLKDKLTCDTKIDLVRWKDIPKTQEFLSEMLGFDGKYHMTQAKWRKANRLTPEGLQETEKRVTNDVIQHIWLRKELLKRDWLGKPRVWRSG